jgi:CheY-like chemotaxis protein
LGLAIAQSHLKLMGSQLECLSELGKGSRFSFSLHMDLVPCLDAQGLKSHSQRIKSLAAGVVVRAMVVDDVKENRAVLSQFLQSIGVLCLQADSGKLALEILRQRLPEMSLDIVFCDIKMPGMSGLEFTRILVEEMHCKRPILVAVTAFAFANQRQEYLKAGFDEFLPKPVQAEALYQVLTQTLKVEFDYEPVPSEAPQTLDWANLKIPAELREAIVQAARMHSVTDLGECVVALLELGSAYEPLAWQIRSFARGYDMKSILDLMNKMNLTA